MLEDGEDGPGRERLTANMDTALVCLLLEQRGVIHRSNREEAMAKPTTIERNETLLDYLERGMKGDPNMVLELLECLRLAQPAFAETFIKIEHTVLWVAATPEAAAVVVDVMENSRRVKMEFGPVEHNAGYLCRTCSRFRDISAVLVVMFPDRDGVSHFGSAVKDACSKYSRSLRLLVYSGSGGGAGNINPGTTVRVTPRDRPSESFTLPDSILHLPAYPDASSAPSSGDYIIDPYCVALSSSDVVPSHTPSLICCTTCTDISSSDTSTSTSAEVCLNSIVEHTLVDSH